MVGKLHKKPYNNEWMFNKGSVLLLMGNGTTILEIFALKRSMRVPSISVA